MELPSGGKENVSAPSSFFPSYSSAYPLTSQAIPSNISKKPKLKPKPQKGFPSNVRAGDWVCLVCNNLNFSFRNECNRCQLQTKEQNQIQRLYISENQNFSEDPLNRLPFKDLTNQKYAQAEYDAPGYYSQPLPKEDINPVLLQRQNIDNGARDANIQNLLDFNLSEGFENMLLVTPPKNGNLGPNSFKEYSDSTQKELPPYKSPKHLPSVSPMLKEVSGVQELKEGEKRERKTHQYFTFIKENHSEQENPENSGYSQQQLIDNSSFFSFPNTIDKPEPIPFSKLRHGFENLTQTQKKL